MSPNISSDAGMPARPEMLVNVPKLVTAYFEDLPDSSIPQQTVLFGTSGHRENIYKIYAESFRGNEHLQKILEEAQKIVNTALR